MTAEVDKDASCTWRAAGDLASEGAEILAGTEDAVEEDSRSGVGSVHSNDFVGKGRGGGGGGGGAESLARKRGQ